MGQLYTTSNKFPEVYVCQELSILVDSTSSQSYVGNRMMPFLDLEGGSQNVFVVISSLKIPKAFFIRSGAQQNFAYTFLLTLPTDLPFQIFHLFSFHVIDLKLDTEPSLVYCLCSV